MVLDPLATTTDLAARLGRALTGPESTRAAELLADASGMIRAKVRQRITRGVSTARLRPWAVPRTVGGRTWPAQVRLPQRPVNSVSAVVDVDGNAVTFRWLGDDVIVVDDGGPVDVTYDHGLDASNDDLGRLGAVAGIVCQVVGRALGRPADETALTSEQVDGYSYTVGAAASAGPFGMLDDEASALADLFGQRTAGTVRLA